MDVSRQNFEEVLPKVKKSIDEADFICIDCELTGLDTVKNINPFDSIPKYYLKVKESSREFLVIQYGISTFRYNKESNVFKNASYNFYIFRRPVNKNVPDQRFLCQTSSIDFLISQGFDFNKLFKEGISYLNLNEENKYLQYLEEKPKKSIANATSVHSKQDKIEIPATEQLFVNNTIKAISDYIESEKTEPLELPKCSPFCRRLIYQETAEIFSDKIFIETKVIKNRERFLQVTRVRTPEELEKIERRAYEEDVKIFETCVGFTKVMRMIIQSGKLVVGHNFILDILHSVDKFLTPLPDDYEEFKECLHNLFPRVLDTKYMSSSAQFKDVVTSTALVQLIETVQKKPFEIPKIEIEDDCCGYSLDDKKEHEAAFDSYTTGVSFLAMWNYLGKKAELSPEEIFANFDLVKSYFDKIYIMKLYDNPHINLVGEDPKLNRDHVFFISFPAEWNVNDIHQVFSPFGNVYISWLSDTSAYVALYKKEYANSAFRSLSQTDTFKLKRYNDFQKQSADPSSQSLQQKQKKPGNNTPAAMKKRKAIQGTSTEAGKDEVVVKKMKSPAKPTPFKLNEEW